MKCSFLSAVPLALMTAESAFAQSPGVYGHPHMYDTHGFGMFMGPVFMLVFLAALIVGIVALIRWIVPANGSSDGKNNAALSALNLRFANGEIDAKEYAERKKLLIE